jgi:uncharacterized protein (TIGR02266 family)
MTQDTRKDRRVKIVSLNVRYKSATVDEFIENHAYDVSRGGIFIKTANPFPPGTLLKFEIRLASDQAVIAGVGRIVWKRDAGASSSDRPAGMGVKFIKIDEPSKVVIDRLVNTKADAGRAYEVEANAKAPSDRPVPRVTPSARPAIATPVAAVPRATGVRSMSPAGGIAAAGKGSAMGGAVPPTRKATMIGVGAAPVPLTPSASPAASSLPSTVPPVKPSFPAAPSAPPRPGGGGSPMFPKSRESDWPPKQEPTVMKQAAELLEEALREAGGSMEEIGTNPLFSGTGGTSSAVADHPKTPLPSSSGWATADVHPPPEARSVEDAVPPAPEEKPIARPSGAPRSTRETPTSVRPASAVARVSDAPAAKKKSGAGTAILLAIAAAAVFAGIVKFRDQLFGSTAPPEPVAAPPPATQPAASPVPPASTTLAQAALSAMAAASAKSEPAPATASGQPSASAAASSVPTVQRSAEPTNAAASAVPSPAPRTFRPVARPMPPPAAATIPVDTGGATTPPSEASPSPTSASSASSSAVSAPPPIKAAAPAPRPRPAKPPPDDNPY